MPALPKGFLKIELRPADRHHSQVSIHGDQLAVVIEEYWPFLGNDTSDYAVNASAITGRRGIRRSPVTAAPSPRALSAFTSKPASHA